MFTHIFRNNCVDCVNRCNGEFIIVVPMRTVWRRPTVCFTTHFFYWRCFRWNRNVYKYFRFIFMDENRKLAANYWICSSTFIHQPIKTSIHINKLMRLLMCCDGQMVNRFYIRVHFSLLQLPIGRLSHRITSMEIGFFNLSTIQRPSLLLQWLQSQHIIIAGHPSLGDNTPF